MRVYCYAEQCNLDLGSTIYGNKKMFWRRVFGIQHNIQRIFSHTSCNWYKNATSCNATYTLLSCDENLRQFDLNPISLTFLATTMKTITMSTTTTKNRLIAQHWNVAVCRKWPWKHKKNLQNDIKSICALNRHMQFLVHRLYEMKFQHVLLSHWKKNGKNRPQIPLTFWITKLSATNRFAIICSMLFN